MSRAQGGGWGLAGSPDQTPTGSGDQEKTGKLCSLGGPTPVCPAPAAEPGALPLLPSGLVGFPPGGGGGVLALQALGLLLLPLRGGGAGPGSGSRRQCWPGEQGCGSLSLSSRFGRAEVAPGTEWAVQRTRWHWGRTLRGAASCPCPSPPVTRGDGGQEGAPSLVTLLPWPQPVDSLSAGGPGWWRPCSGRDRPQPVSRGSRPGTQHRNRRPDPPRAQLGRRSVSVCRGDHSGVCVPGGEHGGRWGGGGWRWLDSGKPCALTSEVQPVPL